jgi:hypothetical protein
MANPSSQRCDAVDELLGLMRNSCITVVPLEPLTLDHRKINIQFKVVKKEMGRKELA